jgi:predicted short-subunit dehydrogenase-like oxidoreductase (DUF2520 family)
MSNSPKQEGKKPSMAIVGSGRLGTALAIALTSLNYEVEALVARTVAHARQAAALVGSEPLALSVKQLQQLPASQLLLITTPDGAILDVAKSIANLNTPTRGRIVLHTSGALAAAEVLAPLAAVGFSTGSLHPLVSISTPQRANEKLRGGFYCIEGEVAARRVAASIVSDLGGHSFHIAAKDKALYHAAAVMASGHVTALIAVAIEMLVQCGLDKKTARHVLVPLLESTVANLSDADPPAALTGTFARGDLVTVKRHLRALSDKKLAEALAAYKLLGRRSLDLAQKKIDPAISEQILRKLNS